MSRPRALSAYPSRYLDIANDFQNGTRKRTFTAASPKAAASLRLDLYSFRAALARDGLTAEYSQFFSVRMFLRGKKLYLVHADEPFKGLVK